MRCHRNALSKICRLTIDYMLIYRLDCSTISLIPPNKKREIITIQDQWKGGRNVGAVYRAYQYVLQELKNV